MRASDRAFQAIWEFRPESASFKACYPPVARAGLIGRASRCASARVFPSPGRRGEIGFRCGRTTVPRLPLFCARRIPRRVSSTARVCGHCWCIRACSMSKCSVDSPISCLLLSFARSAGTSLIDECALAVLRAVSIYLGEDHETHKARRGRSSI